MEDEHTLDRSTQVLTIWGLIGVRTNKIGYKHVWEVWYAVVYFPCLRRLNRRKALSSILWLIGLPMVRFQPIDDMRGLSSPPNVSISCYFV